MGGCVETRCCFVKFKSLRINIFQLCLPTINCTALLKNIKTIIFDLGGVIDEESGQFGVTRVGHKVVEKLAGNYRLSSAGVRAGDQTAGEFQI